MSLSAWSMRSFSIAEDASDAVMSGRWDSATTSGPCMPSRAFLIGAEITLAAVCPSSVASVSWNVTPFASSTALSSNADTDGNRSLPAMARVVPYGFAATPEDSSCSSSAFITPILARFSSAARRASPTSFPAASRTSLRSTEPAWPAADARSASPYRPSVFAYNLPEDSSMASRPAASIVTTEPERRPDDAARSRSRSDTAPARSAVAALRTSAAWESRPRVAGYHSFHVRTEANGAAWAPAQNASSSFPSRMAASTAAASFLLAPKAGQAFESSSWQSRTTRRRISAAWSLSSLSKDSLPNGTSPAPWTTALSSSSSLAATDG